MTMITFFTLMASLQVLVAALGCLVAGWLAYEGWLDVLALRHMDRDGRLLALARGGIRNGVLLSLVQGLLAVSGVLLLQLNLMLATDHQTAMTWGSVLTPARTIRLSTSLISSILLLCVTVGDYRDREPFMQKHP